MLWTSEGPSGQIVSHERLLPTGDMHLAFRLIGDPFRFPDGTDRTLGHAVVGGARSTSYVRELPRGATSAGAQLLPGAAWALLGVPANELAERHTPLEDLWRRPARSALDRLREASDPEDRLDALEAALILALRTRREPLRAATRRTARSWPPRPASPAERA